MNLNQFKALDKVEQHAQVMNHGFLLMTYVRGDTMFETYRLFDFFVKFCYDLIDDKEPRIIGFISSDFYLNAETPRNPIGTPSRVTW